MDVVCLGTVQPSPLWVESRAMSKGAFTVLALASVGRINNHNEKGVKDE